MGDLDGDGITDLAVGAYYDDGGSDRGAVWILFLNSSGNTKSYQKISDTAGTFTGTLDDNDNPVFDVYGTLNVEENQTITRGTLRVLDEGRSSTLTYQVTSAPSHGSLSLNPFTQADIDAGRLTYRHNGNKSATDSFTFTVSDGQGGGIGATTVSIAVSPVNDPPVVSSIAAQSVAEGELLRIKWTATDPEGDAIALTPHGLPEGAAQYPSPRADRSPRGAGAVTGCRAHATRIRRRRRR